MQRLVAGTAALILGIVLSSFITPNAAAKNRIINGSEVTSGFKEVVLLDNSVFPCTATFVGPRVALTAGHCIDSLQTRATVKLRFDGKDYNADFYPSTTSGLDLGVAIVASDVPGVDPMSVGGEGKANDDVTMLGFGCTKLGQPTDGKLRSGNSKISEVNGVNLITKSGAGVCFGDSGGPVYKVGDPKKQILGVSARGDAQGNSYITRTDASEARAFLESIVNTKSVKICGIKSECGSVTPPAPSCTMAVSSPTIKLGEPITVTITTSGQVTSTTIDGTVVTNGSKTFTPDSIGDKLAKGVVTGPGGTGTCEKAYKVETPPVVEKPTCELSANPKETNVGGQVTITMKTTGTVTASTIEGTSVFPSNSKVVTAPAVGEQTVKGTVTGPGGSNSCETKYKVNETPNPKPTCNLTANPSELTIGEKVNLTFTTTGQVTSATVDNEPMTPNSTKSITPKNLGLNTSVGMVSGPGGSSTCRASYNVKDNPGDKPTCTLTAIPDEIQLGESLKLKLTPKGNVTAMTIEGVTTPNGEKTITPKDAGTFSAQATVTGPGGSNSCMTNYRVNNGSNPDKPGCKVTSYPSPIYLGESSLMTLITQGNVTSAMLDGATVDYPIYKKIKRPDTVGKIPILGSASGPAGTGKCQTELEVLPKN